MRKCPRPQLRREPLTSRCPSLARVKSQGSAAENETLQTHTHTEATQSGFSVLRPSLPFSSREKSNRENHTELESNRIRCHHLNDCFWPLFHCATESRLPAKWALIVPVITGISPLIGTEVYCYKRHSHVFSHLFLMATLKRNIIVSTLQTRRLHHTC